MGQHHPALGWVTWDEGKGVETIVGHRGVGL
jgi:hypothetical protein